MVFNKIKICTQEYMKAVFKLVNMSVWIWRIHFGHLKCILFILSLLLLLSNQFKVGKANFKEQRHKFKWTNQVQVQHSV